MPKPTKGPRLGGSPAHQRIILNNLASQLFEHGKITTTEAKAKRLRPVAEKLITKAKRGDLHARRQAYRVLNDHALVKRLFELEVPEIFDGTVEIKDRIKDVIKTGGEWISSLELENIMMDHPAVAEAAAIGVAHPKWDERPILIAKKTAVSQVSEAELLDYYTGKIAKWQIPDRVVFVDSIPVGGTGKVLKKYLRASYGSILLAVE